MWDWKWVFNFSLEDKLDWGKIIEVNIDKYFSSCVLQIINKHQAMSPHLPMENFSCKWVFSFSLENKLERGKMLELNIQSNMIYVYFKELRSMKPEPLLAFRIFKSEIGISLFPW